MVNEAPPAADIAVTTLGGFSVAWGRAVPAAEWSRKRAAALFRILIGSPGFRLGADAVVERLWPESTPLAGRTNLRVKIFEVRAILARHAPPGVDASASPALLFEGGVVALDARYGPKVDALVFERAGLAALERNDDAAIAAVLETYRGPYLPEERDETTLALRERFARIHRALGVRAAAERAGSPERVELLLAPLFEAYPYDEEIALGLATARAALGRRVDVRDLFLAHERALAARSGLAPSPRLAALAGFRNGAASEVHAAGEPRLHVAPGERSTNGAESNGAHPAAPARRLAPLLGRETERRVAEEALETIARGGRLRIELGGAPGVGKTRFARELEALGAARGFSVGFTRAFRDAPLDLLVDELTESLARGGGALSAAQLEPDEPAVLRAALRERAEAGPVLVIVDDAAFAPRSLLEAICGFAPEAPRGFGFVPVARGPASPKPGAGHFASHEQLVLELPPLEASALRAVAAGAFDAAVSGALLDSLANLWPGDLALMLAAATHARTSGAAVSAPGGWSLREGTEAFELIPERNRLAIVRRILALPSVALETMKALAFAGERASPATLSLLIVRPASAVETALDEIAAAGLGARRADRFEVPLAVRTVAGELLSRRRRSLFVERLASGIAQTFQS